MTNASRAAALWLGTVTAGVLLPFPGFAQAPPNIGVAPVVLRRETMLTDLHQRIRDVRQGPDGLLYAITDEDDGAVLRSEF